MEGENNQTTFDVNVYFVVPSKFTSPEECDEDMIEAYNRCPDWDVNPDWITEKKCLGMKPDKKDVFVMQAFEGEAFNKLQNFKCMIIGPRCLLSCFLTGEPIPDGSTPLFNTAMRGVIVSASGFSGAKKSEIQKLVEYMGGIFTKQLRSSCTHLVTEVVMSAKYERAIELGIKIVTYDWVKSVWVTNQNDSVSAKDSIFDKYVCPTFLNLVVTSTNLPKRQKEEVKKLINENGGEFMGVLDGTKVKVVITVKTSSLSEKLKYAMQNNIPCLRVEWVYESIKAGHSLPFNDFIIKSTQASSTPEKSAIQESLNFSTISVIAGDNQNVYIDETLASATMSSTVMNSTAVSEKLSAVPKNNYNSIVDNLNVDEAKKAGPFLDGLNIYLTGFSSNQRDKLNRILTVGCATRLDEISEALTHVIVGDPLKATQDLKEIKSKGLEPCILKIDWLMECLKLKAPAVEDNFIFDCKESKPQATVETASPLSQRNLQLLKRPKRPPAPKFEPDKSEEEAVADDHGDIIQQYLRNASSEKSSIVTKNQSIAEKWNDSTRREKSTFNEEPRDLSAIPISQESCVTQKILQGLVFTVGGFEEQEYTQMIASIHGLGGKIVGKNYLGTPDFGVVPKLGGELKLSEVKEVVTELFIEDCIDNEKLVPIQYYHRPINIKSDVKPLADCVIGMSTYSGAERTYLSKLAEALGARYQDTFARKTNKDKNTYSSTHLVCPKPVGEKYNAAVKWKLPAVTSEWLINCANKMKLDDEALYLVGETMAPERPVSTLLNQTSMNITDNQSNPPAGTTPKRRTMNQDQFPEGTGETPLINKRLNNLLQSTPQNDKSPFHVNTPDTPYGQVFKENPSPRTRKGWVKWIDRFPDLKVDEPPMKKRRSTPLSEVKRQAWNCIVMGRSGDEENDEIKVTEARNSTTIVDNNDVTEPESSHVINRKLSFSEDSSPVRTPKKNSGINSQIAKLDDLLLKASNTPDRQSSSAEHSNPYRLESNVISGNCLVKETQPDSVGWEDPVKRVPPPQQTVDEEPINLNSDEESASDGESAEPKKDRPKFMFSGIKDKDQAEESIKKIGGEVSNESAFDKTATHLLCLKPSRNEKILSSIASGKWVLHFNYLKACEKEKRFVNEEEYELGNPKSEGHIPNANSESEQMIMNAAHRWRLKLMKNPKGAFRDIVALLVTPKEKRDQFERLINAGGGIVVEAKPPYNDSPVGKKITHCFVQPKQIDQQVDWAMMASKGIMCFPPQYLNDHLMAENPLNPKDSVLPEFKKYLALIPK